ncbi:SpoIIE family protein phosphatase [Treponema sp. TIM-1]|uniref:SpoIIE family protein phosphatase n=1 Tax=Treponema sp. TIM-1 TaxID=2898417 RepID=UPI00397FB321
MDLPSNEDTGRHRKHGLGRRLFSLAFLLFLSRTLYALSDFYWENPEVFSPGAGSFPVAASNGDMSMVAWQESRDIPAAGSNTAGDGLITVSLALKAADGTWRFHPAVGGPYVYGGAEPAILSAAMDPGGRILIAAAVSSTETELLISDDRGETFRKVRLNFGSETSLAPRIFSRSGGGYYLFISRGVGQSLDLYYARSLDGFSWSSFTPLVRDGSLTLNFLPTLSSVNGTDYVVFQSLVKGEENPAFQLFITASSNGGLTWTPPRRITQFQTPSPNTAASADRFDNQRPFLLAQNNRLYLVWERRYAAGPPQIYGAFIRENGNVEGIVERINTDEGYGNNPIAFWYEGEITLVWFDNRRGNNQVFLAQKSGAAWQNYELSGAAGRAAIFVRPVVDRDGLSLFWQGTSRGMDRIYARFPDRSVTPPRLRAENFTPGRPSRGNRVRISWNIPYDPSGIRGFSYVWSRSPEAEPPKQIRVSADAERSVEENADGEGAWYFTLIAQDYAGNWSPPVRLEYLRDITPPPAVNLIDPPTDDQGYLLSNTFSLGWSAVPDIAGYTWKLEYLGPVGPLSALGREDFLSAAEKQFPPVSRPSPRIMGRALSVSYTNQDNGIWSFTLAAVDAAGNIGEPSRVFLRTNKYVPHTYISYVDAHQDDQGVLSLRILGRGFTENGAVRRIFLDLDGFSPYDREFQLARGDFQIRSDREITLEGIDDILEGRYRIGVEHPLRGLYLTDPLVSVDEIGTVKYGDYSRIWQPSWRISRERRWVFNMILPLIMVITAFCGIGSVTSVRGIGTVMADNAAIQVEAAALMTGDLMPMEKKKQIKIIRRRGMGLRLKLASYTITLVLLVVLIVSAPLYYMMIRIQETTLLQGLWNRSVVLLEGLASGARLFLPAEDLLELGFLPDQSSSIPEAGYVTITGFGADSTIFDDYVWATNDPAILSKIDTLEFKPGISRLQDTLSPRLEGIVRELDQRAREEVGDLTASIAALTQEGISLTLNTDTASRQRMEDIQVTTRSLDDRLTEKLAEISREIGSEPEYPAEYFTEAGNRRFILFKPVMYRQGVEDTYFRGLIRLEISIDSIIELLSREQRTLLEIILAVALTALLIGILGASILSALLIRPLRKLMDHVALIRDTEDKTRLAGVDIQISSGDEIALLGKTINDMTQGLVQAALASHDLSIGKEVQKKFIPLETNHAGDKLTFGRKDTKDLSFFGYYEGAKGVSGDYFDYLDLDGRYFAVIICDVAGKGIPAALIMIQVATIFLTYFKNWEPTEKGLHIEELAYQINDFIESQAFRDRFAAFTLCLFDSQTGLARFCNAGDNIVHWYDASNHKMNATTLRATPAIGVLSNAEVESMGGYTVETLTFNQGDILFLYTDGIEDSKRKFRNQNFKEILCTDGPPDTPHGNHRAGQGDETLGYDRVTDIINGVMNKKIYSLYKYHDPEGEKKLLFDFTTCKGTVEEAILALVSVEKMFRCYRDPQAREDSRVLVDKTVDRFLQDHFLQYREYCFNTREGPGNDTYMCYTHLKEDDQFDDLAILGIMRK